MPTCGSVSTSDAETLLRSRRHRADNQVLRTTKDHHFQFPPLCLAVSVSFNFSCPHSVSLSLSFNFRSIQVHGELRQCALTPVRWVSQSEADWRRSAPPRPPRQSSPAAAELEPRPHLRDSCSCRASHCPARMAQLPWDQ